MGELQPLEGFDGDRPRLRAPASAMVRELITHTAGLGYFFVSEMLLRWHRVVSRRGREV